MDSAACLIQNPLSPISMSANSQSSPDLSSSDSHCEIKEEHDEDNTFFKSPDSPDNNRKRPKKKYSVISQAIREQFIKRVLSKEATIKQAAKEFGLKFSTSKAILQTFKKEGRIGKKKNRERKTRVVNTVLLATLNPFSPTLIPFMTVNDVKETTNSSSNQQMRMNSHSDASNNASKSSQNTADNDENPMATLLKNLPKLQTQGISSQKFPAGDFSMGQARYGDLAHSLGLQNLHQSFGKSQVDMNMMNNLSMAALQQQMLNNNLLQNSAYKTQTSQPGVEVNRMLQQLIHLQNKQQQQQQYNMMLLQSLNLQNQLLANLGPQAGGLTQQTSASMASLPINMKPNGSYLDSRNENMTTVEKMLYGRNLGNDNASPNLEMYSSEPRKKFCQKVLCGMN